MATQTPQEAQPPRPHLMTLDSVLERAQPLGRNSARMVLLSDPRFPKPVLGTEGRKLFSAKHIDAYFEQVEADGFPHMEAEVTA